MFESVDIELLNSADEMEQYIALVLGFLTLALAIFSWVTSQTSNNYWRKHGVTEVKTESVVRRYLRGHFNSLESDLSAYQQLKREGKAYGGVYEFGNPILVVVDLDLIREIFIKSFDHFTDMMHFDIADEDPHMHHVLFNMQGEEWKKLRNTLTPSFTTGRIRRMMHIFQSSSDKFKAACQMKMKESSGGIVDLHALVLRYTLDVIASTAFGVETDLFKDENSVFMKMGLKWQSTFNGTNFLKVEMLQKTPKLAKLFNFRLTDQEADGFLSHLIKECIASREKTGFRRDDFLQLILDAKSEDSEITDDVIIAQALLFILGGFDTVEVLLNCASYELALNPDVQEKLYRQLAQISEQEGGLSYDNINGLQYLDMVVSETLRVHTPAHRLSRLVTKPYKLPDSDVELFKNQMIVVPACGVHQDPEYWPNPEKFDPLRFTKENIAQRHPMAYLVFGHGPRQCIGNRFALVEAKVAVANMVLAFKLEPCKKTDIPLKVSKKSFPYKPVGATWLKVTPRVS